MSVMCKGQDNGMAGMGVVHCLETGLVWVEVIKDGAESFGCHGGYFRRL